MRKHLLVVSILALALSLSTSSGAGTWTGTIKVGGVSVDEEGDLSTVQETYNVHDGFNLSQIRLTGTSTAGNYLLLNLRDINLESRKGDLLFRRAGKFKLNASFDQHRQIFDPERSVSSERKDWSGGIKLTPNKAHTLTAQVNHVTRTGDRSSYPGGTNSALGTEYDYAMTTMLFGADARTGRRGVALNYRVTDFTDELNSSADRSGSVLSARAYFPCFFYDKWTHLLRGAYGKSELSEGGLDYTLAGFQYTGVVKPDKRFRVKYNFQAHRIDNASTDLQTDRFQNILDLTYYHNHGSLTGGYGYELNDDDRRLTSYNSWRAGATLRGDRVKAKVHYAGRIKKDQEELTLLKDVEASRFRGDIELEASDVLTLGGGFKLRSREFPDINVEAEGQSFSGRAVYSRPGWGGFSTTYTYTKDEYTDLVGGFDADNHQVTGRVDFDRIERLKLSSGITYVDVGEDLDIEKSILFFEGMVAVTDDIHVDVKYNVYNYDDYILIDRYYTGNIVWFNVAYDLHLD